MPFRALNDSCRGGERDDEDQRAERLVSPDECRICSAPDGTDCDEEQHQLYDAALSAAMEDSHGG